MAALVVLSEDEGRAQEVAAFLAGVVGADAVGDIGTAAAGVLAAGVRHLDAVIGKATEEDAEGFFLLLSSFFRDVDADALHGVISSILTSVAANAEQRAALRLRM